MAFQLLYNYPMMGDLFSSLGARYQRYPSRVCHNSGRQHQEGWVSAKAGLSRVFQKCSAGPNALRGPHEAREQGMRVNLCRLSSVLHHFLPVLEATCFEVF